jgi:hypothetical protein
MYLSDYPHFEAPISNSVDYFFDSTLGTDLRRELFWENPVSFLREPQGIPTIWRG